MSTKKTLNYRKLIQIQQSQRQPKEHSVSLNSKSLYQ